MVTLWALQAPAPCAGREPRGQIPYLVSIPDRPPEIEERQVPDHWDGDLIKGTHNHPAVGTLVEPTALFTVLSKMDTATAKAAPSGFSHVLNRTDEQRRLSMTYNQSREKAANQRLTKANRVKVYFADPHNP